MMDIRAGIPGLSAVRKARKQAVMAYKSIFMTDVIQPLVCSFNWTDDKDRNISAFCYYQLVAGYQWVVYIDAVMIGRIFQDRYSGVDNEHPAIFLTFFSALKIVKHMETVNFSNENQ